MINNSFFVVCSAKQTPLHKVYACESGLDAKRMVQIRKFGPLGGPIRLLNSLFFLTGRLTEERDLWSSAAYTLSLKVTDKHSLNNAKKLHLCERAWAKLSRHFAIYLSENDSVQVRDPLRLKSLGISWESDI